MDGERNSGAPDVTRIVVLTVDQAVGQAFMDTVCGVGSAEVVLDAHAVRLSNVLCMSGSESALRGALEQGDGAVLLVCHLDALSMESLKAAYRLVPNDPGYPSSFLIVRDAGKLDFKLSCPTCGQKLWVRDEDAGRAGRCPHCKKSFVLPAQSAHLKTVLMLPETVTLQTVTRGNAGTCRGPIAALAERARHRARALLNATMRVHVANGDPPAPPSAAG